jgi:acyl carrier protein
MTEATAAVRTGPTRTERDLIALSEQALGREGLTAHDDLFDLGITSLAFIRLLVSVRTQFGVGLTGAELGDDATIANLAAVVDAALTRELGGIRHADRAGSHRLRADR